MPAAEMSSSKSGDIRLDYHSPSGRKIKLWQPWDKYVLETTFKQDGSVVLQRLLKTSSVLDCLDSGLKEAGCESVKGVEFSKVKLDKPCPSCSKRSLERYVDAYRSNNDVPVMPIYVCSECKSKSYHLTDEYLLYLVKSNPNMFESAELAKLDADGETFITELKQYIISIFASKKIKRIE